MKRLPFMPACTLLMLALISSCSGQVEKGPRLSKEPVSIRGWIEDISTAPAGFKVLTGETQRKRMLFQESYVSIDNAPFASGGVAENGGFIILDVPPGEVTLTFQAPGVPAARLQLHGLPPNADVYLKGISLSPTTGVTVLKPEDVLVRVPGDSTVKERSELPSKTFVANRRVRVIRAPLPEMSDRRDYPAPGRPAPPS